MLALRRLTTNQTLQNTIDFNLAGRGELKIKVKALGSLELLFMNLFNGSFGISVRDEGIDLFCLWSSA